MENKELVGSVRKNTMENVQVHVQRYQGITFVDARVWLKGFSADPRTVIATRKGLCLRPEVVKQLLPILAEAQARAEALEQEGPGKGGSS